MYDGDNCFPTHTPCAMYASIGVSPSSLCRCSWLNVGNVRVCIVHEQMAQLPVVALAAVLFFSGASQRVFLAESQPHVLL